MGGRVNSRWLQVQDLNLRAQAPNSESRYWHKVRCYPASGSLIARKFSLLRRLGNSVANRLNFPPKAEAPWLSQKNDEFPCIFPCNREQARGDEFADDCFLRHTILIYKALLAFFIFSPSIGPC
jgi:hypothetical protein